MTRHTQLVNTELSELPACRALLPSDPSGTCHCELVRGHTGFHLASVYWGPVPVPEQHEHAHYHRVPWSDL